MTESIGWKWLAETYGITPVHRFRVESRLGTSRKTMMHDGYTQESYPIAFRPDPTLQGHLTFALKHEGIHLEFLARLFDKVDSEILVKWIEGEPTGIYARRTGFLYEWLTGKTLPVNDVFASNYVDAINEDDYLTASVPVNNQRWRVRDNLPGTRDFCPVVLLTSAIRAAQEYDCAQALRDIEVEYGKDVLMRSAVWLTIKESRASFAIEHEEDQVDRVKRFAAAMENRCGKSGNSLSEKALTELQAEILGEMATRYGFRKSPVFVGHTNGYVEVVDYIAPDWTMTSALLLGLQGFEMRTKGRAPILRAAVVSFGFVYIHPMADGNGRISRFLVNDILRCDGAVPEPFILPISATINNSAQARAGYDRSLEQFSKPLMQHYKEDYGFGPEEVGADGVKHTLKFYRYDDALFAWRFPDLTSHCEYLKEVIQVTITDEMHREAQYLNRIEMARAGIKQWVEGPNGDIDRIIRSIKDNGGNISGKLMQEFPVLGDTRIGENVAKIVREIFVANSKTQGE